MPQWICLKARKRTSINNIQEDNEQIASTGHRETATRLYRFVIVSVTSSRLCYCSVFPPGPTGSHLSTSCNAKPFCPPSQGPLYSSSAFLQTTLSELHFLLVPCLPGTRKPTCSSLDVLWLLLKAFSPLSIQSLLLALRPKCRTTPSNVCPHRGLYRLCIFIMIICASLQISRVSGERHFIQLCISSKEFLFQAQRMLLDVDSIS